MGKIPWSRKWQPTLVFLPEKSHGQRNVVGYSPWGHKRVGHDLETTTILLKLDVGTSLVVLWLGLSLPLQKARIKFLVGELSSCKLCGMTKKEYGVMVVPIQERLGP